MTRLPVDQGWTRRHTLFQRMSFILPSSEALGGNCRPKPRHAQPRRSRQKRSSTLCKFAFHNTIRLRPSQRESLEHQFPAHICWKDGEWQAKMTAWHYTMCKNKTLRWLREMKRRHSTTTDIISPVKDTQVIYAVYHISLPRRLYVGQTGNTAFDRFKKHVQCAKSIFRDGIAEGEKAPSISTWRTSAGRDSGYSPWKGSRGCFLNLQKVHRSFSGRQCPEKIFGNVPCTHSCPTDSALKVSQSDTSKCGSHEV